MDNILLEYKNSENKSIFRNRFYGIVNVKVVTDNLSLITRKKQSIRSKWSRYINYCWRESQGICRVMNVSLSWLLIFFRQVTSDIPADLGVIKPKKSKLTIELDEMWSFVGSKANKQWIWLAIDRATGQIVGFHIGGRGEEDAKKLWQSLHPVYRQCAVFYSDFWHAYEKIEISTSCCW